MIAVDTSVWVNAAPVWSLDAAFDRLEQLRLIAQYEPGARR